MLKIDSDQIQSKSFVERWGLSITLLCLALFAVALRARGLSAGLPYIGYIDEGHILHPVMTMVTDGSWDPGWYKYPSLTVNLIALAAVTVDWLSQIGVFSPLIAEVPIRHKEFYDLIGPWQLVVLGRLVVLTHGLVLVCLCGMAGRLVGRNGYAGLLSLGVSAVTPALVFRSSIVAVDTLAATYFLLALFFSALMILKRPMKVHAVLGGATAALAFTSKYQAGAALGAVIIAVMFASELSVPQRFSRLLLCLSSFVLTSVVSMPALFFRPAEVFEDIRLQMAIYASKSGGLTLAEQATRGNELGVIWIILCVFGFIALFAFTRTRPVAMAWTVAIFPLMVVAYRFEYQPLRNLLPVIATGCVTCGFFLSYIVERTRRYQYIVPLAILSYGVFLGVRCYSMMEQHGDKTDSRCEVVKWLVENVNLGERVFFEKELAFLPSEIARLPHLVFSAERESLRHDVEASSGDILVVGVKLRQELGEMEPPGLVLLSVGSKETPPRPAQWRKNNQKIFAVRVQ